MGVLLYFGATLYIVNLLIFQVIILLLRLMILFLALGDLPAIMAILMEVVELLPGIFFDNFLINIQVLGVSLAILTISLMRVKKGGTPLDLRGLSTVSSNCY